MAAPRIRERVVYGLRTADLDAHAHGHGHGHGISGASASASTTTQTMAQPITSWPEARSRRDNDGHPTAHLYNWQKNRLAARARQLDIARLESLTMPSALNNYAKASAMTAAWPAFLDMSDDERDYALDLCATWLRDAHANEWYRDPASLPWDESHHPDPATLRFADRHALRRRGSGGESGYDPGGREGVGGHSSGRERGREERMQDRGRRDDVFGHDSGQERGLAEHIQDRGRRENVDRQDRGQDHRWDEHIQDRGRRELGGRHGSGQDQRWNEHLQDRGRRESIDSQDRGQDHRWEEHAERGLTEHVQDRGRREIFDRQHRGQEHVQDRGGRENVDRQVRGQEHRWQEHVQGYTPWDHRREHTMEDSAESSSQDSVLRLGEGPDRSQVGVGERPPLDEDEDEDDNANATASRGTTKSNLNHSRHTANLRQQHAQTDSQAQLKFRLPACTTSQGIELPAGTIVSYIRDSSGGWAKVETHDAKRHWVARGLLRPVQ